MNRKAPDRHHSGPVVTPVAQQGRPEAPERPPIFTVGHSTRTIGEFVAMRWVGEVGLVVDIRSAPRSRTNPVYNLDRLPDEARTNRGLSRRLSPERRRYGRSPHPPSRPPATATMTRGDNFWLGLVTTLYSRECLSGHRRNGIVILFLFWVVSSWLRPAACAAAWENGCSGASSHGNGTWQAASCYCGNHRISPAG